MRFSRAPVWIVDAAKPLGPGAEKAAFSSRKQRAKRLADPWHESCDAAFRDRRNAARERSVCHRQSIETGKTCYAERF
jgi:hypothetical protein